MDVKSRAPLSPCWRPVPIRSDVCYTLHSEMLLSHA
jgi:hypothetical protein